MEFNISEKMGSETITSNNSCIEVLYCYSQTLLSSRLEYQVICALILNNSSANEYGDMVASNIASYISAYEYTFCFALLLCLHISKETIMFNNLLNYKLISSFNGIFKN